MITSKQRVLAAINHRAADRTSITFDAEVEVYDALHKYLGTKTKEELFDRLHVDTWMILPKNFMYLKEYKNKDEKVSIWGYKTRKAFYSGGSYDELVESPLAGKHNIEDIDEHPWPDRGTLDFPHIPDKALEHKNLSIICPFIWGSYFIATFVRGMEDLFMEFVVPYMIKMVKIVHDYDKIFLLHVCGAVRPLLPIIIDAGVDMLEPIQIRAEGMEPVDLKRDFGKDICFYGGVDLQKTL